MHWMKVITNPLGIAGFALALVFGVVSRVVVQKGRKNTQWIVPAAYALAAACVLGGLALAYHRESIARSARPEPAGAPALSQTKGSAAPSMRIDKIDQTVGTGAAVAGVQGDVTVNPPNPHKESKPKQ